MVKTLGLIPGRGTKIPQAMWRGQKKKKSKSEIKNICTCDTSVDCLVQS